MSEAAQAVCIGCGTASTITYVIGVALSWAFSRGLFLESSEALAAAVIITIPVFVSVAGCICGATSSTDQCEASEGAALLGCGAGAFSGVLDLVGLGLLIAAMAKAPSELDDPIGPIVCGVFAAIFVLVSAITSFAALGGLVAAGK